MYATPLLRSVPTAAGESLCCQVWIGDNLVVDNPACRPTGGFALCNLPGIEVRSCEISVGPVTVSG